MTVTGADAPAFIDSNIWLYALLAQQDVTKEKRANELLAAVGQNTHISSQVVIKVVAPARYLRMQGLFIAFHRCLWPAPLAVWKHNDGPRTSRKRSSHRVMDAVWCHNWHTCGISVNG